MRYLKRGKIMEKKLINCTCIIVLCISVGLTGCSNTQHMVLAATGTVIGIDISQDPATQTPHAKIGYNRGELAIVPTNRAQCVKKQNSNQFECTPVQGGGAKDSTDVLMELRFKSPFSFQGNAGIYQRLAVGENAVTQPGAAFMFAKDDSGELKPDTAKAVSNAITAEALSAKQLTAVDKISKGIVASDNKVDIEKLQNFLRCAGFNNDEVQKYVNKYQNKSQLEFKTAFKSDLSWEATDFLEKCRKSLGE